MKKYDAYKDSGVEWIGDIPSHWSSVRIKRLTNIKRGSSPRPIDDPKYFDDENGEYHWIRISDVSRSGKYLECTEQKLSELGSSLSHKLEENEIVMSISGSVGKVFITKTKCCIHDGFVTFQNPKIERDILYYLLTNDELYSKDRKLGTQFNINSDIVGNKYIPSPPIQEQEQIVFFLDTKTSLIDSLIEKTQKKIELLKEKRTSLINEVVTKGLNPKVEMKDSGVEWIGEIPSHWEIGKLKYLSDENLRNLSNSTDPNYKLKYIEISDVNTKGVIGNQTDYIFSKSPSRCRRIVKKGDVIVSTVRTYLKSIGLIENYVENLICSTGFSVLTPRDNMISKYLFYLLRTEWFIAKVISKSEGVSYPSIQSEKLMNIDVVYCGLDEQEQIVSYLDKQTGLIDKTISIEEKRITLLKEYRQSLISEVVTGKRKVV